MNSLMFLIYLAAVGVSIVLERQAKRQKSGIALECARLGLPVPPARPKIQTLEALLNIAIGGVLVVPAVFGFWLILREPFIRENTGAGMIDFYSLLLAAGLTLMYLGGEALRQNLIHRRDVSQKMLGGRES
jgi:hypothetical protein